MKPTPYAEGLCQFCFDPMRIEYNIYGDVVFSCAEITLPDGSFIHVCERCFEMISIIATRRIEAKRWESWTPRLGVILAHEYLKVMRAEVCQ